MLPKAIAVSTMFLAFFAAGAQGIYAQSAADRGDAAQSTRSVMQRPISRSPSFPQSPSSPAGRSSQDPARDLQQGLRQKQTLERYKRYYGTDRTTQGDKKKSPDVTTDLLY